MAATKKKVVKKKAGTTRARRGTQNYVNNARLMENIIESKRIWEERKADAEAQWKREHRGINDPDAIPAVESMDYWPSAAECMTGELVKMIMMLVEKYATRANWRGYTYIDDMKSEATISLLNGTLKFKPEVSQNPFGYMTQIVTHSFITTLEKEKKVRNIRDDTLEQNGLTPSHTRQLENELRFFMRQVYDVSMELGGMEQAYQAILAHGFKDAKARELIESFGGEPPPLPEEDED